MVRVCPNCNTRLGTYDRHFCSACGEKLPSNISISKYSPKKLKFADPTLDPKREQKEFVNNIKEVFKNVGHILNVKGILIAVLVVISAFFVINYFVPLGTIKDIEIKSETYTPVVIEPESVVLDVDDFYKKGVFDSSLAEYTPYNADIYIEAKDFEAFSAVFVDLNEDYSDLINSLDNKFTDTIGVFVKKVDDVFSWGIILMPSREIDFDELNFSDYGKWQASIIEGAVFITNNEKLNPIAFNSKRNLEKNLTHNSVYARALSQVPDSGSIFVLPLTKQGKEYIFNWLEESLSSSSRYVLSTYLDSDLDYAVIL